MNVSEAGAGSDEAQLVAPSKNRSKQWVIGSAIAFVAVVAVAVSVVLVTGSSASSSGWDAVQMSKVDGLANVASSVRQDLSGTTVSTNIYQDCLAMRVASEDDENVTALSDPTLQRDWQDMRTELSEAAQQCLQEVPSGSIDDSVQIPLGTGLGMYSQLKTHISGLGQQ